MSEKLPEPAYIDIRNPDYESLALILAQINASDALTADDLRPYRGNAIVAVVINWLKEPRTTESGDYLQFLPDEHIPKIFGQEVWGEGDLWI